MAAPLRGLELVLTNIRMRRFDPDSTRSGRWKGQPFQLGHMPSDEPDQLPQEQSGAASSCSQSAAPTPQQCIEEESEGSSSDSSSSNAGSDDLGPIAVHRMTGVTHRLLTDDQGFKLACGRRFTSSYVDTSVDSEDMRTFCKVCFTD
eukprot:585383-Amphidinium_carterae.1